MDIPRLNFLNNMENTEKKNPIFAFETSIKAWMCNLIQKWFKCNNNNNFREMANPDLGILFIFLHAFHKMLSEN